MPRFVTVYAAIIFLVAPLALAAEKPPAVTDPAVAAKDPDFNLQGEYGGDIGDEKWGIQVIALGGGKFHGVGYVGGLPGDGWDGERKVERDGDAQNGEVAFVGERGGKAVVKDGVVSAFNTNGEKIGELKRVVRQSPTMGAKPPEGAKVLFDGKTNDFKPGKTDGEFLTVDKTGGQNSQTKFQSCTVHVEFITPWMPTARGQGRGNSGVYLQGRYEVQVLDSFGLKGENNECGGLYSIAKPRVNMCLPPLVWQTYDIDYTAAQYDAEGNQTKPATMTVRHNGELVHENVELPKPTTAAPVKKGPEPAHLHLQDHGNPVRYRNIWIVEKK
jgi:hypothetical protein